MLGWHSEFASPETALEPTDALGSAMTLAGPHAEPLSMFLPIAMGLKVVLRRAEMADRSMVYAWLAASDLTASHLGPPLFADHPPPSFEQFCDDFPQHLFDGSRPFAGRGLIVHADDRDVGFICHGAVNLCKDVVDLNIWHSTRRDCGRGYGSEALIVVCDWLQESLGVNRFLMRPSRRNVRALRALRRAGFRETDLHNRDVVEKLSLPPGRYSDEMLMFRILPPPRVRLALEPRHTYVFVDSEFTSLAEPRLISVGAVATDSTAFYCELDDWSHERCSEFVRDTVLPLLDGDAVPHMVAAESFLRWISERAAKSPTTIISDSGFDRWAVADLLGREDLPAGVDWLRVPVPYEELDTAAASLGLRRHHALDDARALRHLVLPNGS